MADSTIRGRFVWHELMTTDPAGAQRFYSQVVGWTTAPFPGEPSYTIWQVGGAGVGGCMAMPPELRAKNVPSNWLAYIGSPNVDDTSAEVTRLGGTVQREPMEIPDVGRFAVIMDPEGAVFAIFTPSREGGGRTGAPVLGDFSWHELASTNPKAGFQFYRSLFGWERTGDFDMGPMGVYEMFGIGGVPMGGIYPKPAEVPVSNWLPYAKVASADQSAATAKEQGGTILQGPIEVPGGDRVAIGMDPQGAIFAVHSGKV
jgi:predicted enzyme related to lactoylglutathione lyase